MTAFHTITIPHDDILQGDVTMDVFAADLWDMFKECSMGKSSGRSNTFRYN